MSQQDLELLPTYADLTAIEERLELKIERAQQRMDAKLEQLQRAVDGHHKVAAEVMKAVEECDKLRRASADILSEQLTLARSDVRRMESTVELLLSIAEANPDAVREIAVKAMETMYPFTGSDNGGQ